MSKSTNHQKATQSYPIMRHKKGFTLIELLVVISVILIVSSVIFVGGSGGEGNKLSSSLRIISGITQGARGQAILKGQNTRIIIYSDSSGNNEVDKRLRYFGIIYRNEDNENQWIAATQGTFLPEGIYFDPALSSANNWTGGSMNLEYPRASPQSEGGGDEYFYYEFNSNGTLVETDNPWLVIRAGNLSPIGGSLQVNFDDESKSELKAAIILRRSGTSTPVLDPADID